MKLCNGSDRNICTSPKFNWWLLYIWNWDNICQDCAFSSLVASGK